VQFSSKRPILAVGLTAGAFAIGATFSACSSSSSSPSTSPDGSTSGNTSAGAGGDGGGVGPGSDGGPGSGNGEDGSTANSGDDGGLTNVDGNTVATAPGSCANPTVGIVFSPMYSAFIPGSTAHTFQIPAITDDGNTATWSISDPTQAQLVPEAFGGLPGVMITVQGVGTGSTGDAGSIGQLTVVATESSGACGAATLNITAAAESDWSIGEMRYNDGVSLVIAPRDGGGGLGGPARDGGFGEGGVGEGGFGGGGPGGGGPGMGGIFRSTDAGSFYELDGGTACTSCHGPTATTGPYRQVSHTPEQTGGFSDDDLVQIFTQGILPDGGYFDPSVINSSCDAGPGSTCYAAAYGVWHTFHQWIDILPSQYPGIIVYLRSLQPEAQNGTSAAANFGGGGRRRDGGPGGRALDGGTGPGDAATE
jgi:hypothetical protein